MNKEMKKLREALDAAGIVWEDNSEDKYGSHFERTKFINNNGDCCSVIFCKGVSYGHQAELLEVMPPLRCDENYEDEVQGWLTADEIISAWVDKKDEEKTNESENNYYWFVVSSDPECETEIFLCKSSAIRWAKDYLAGCPETTFEIYRAERYAEVLVPDPNPQVYYC